MPKILSANFDKAGVNPLSRKLNFIFLIIIGFLLSSCGEKVPDDIDEQREFYIQKINNAPSVGTGAFFMIKFADDGQPATREYLIECLYDYRTISNAAVMMLMNHWLDDEIARREIAKYYMSPMESFHNRNLAGVVIINKFREEYPEFADLPSVPPKPEGIVHVQR